MDNIHIGTSTSISTNFANKLRGTTSVPTFVAVEEEHDNKISTNGNSGITTIPLILHQIVPPDYLTKYKSHIASWDHHETTGKEGDDASYRHTAPGPDPANTTTTTATTSIYWKDHVLYKDDDLSTIVRRTNSTKLWNGWHKFERFIEKVDFVRYALMYNDGGIYADADQQLLDADGLVDLVDSHTRGGESDDDGIILLPFESGGEWNFEQIGQALMISTQPKQQFWWDLMHYVVDNYNKSCNVLQNTGPMMMTNFWSEHVVVVVEDKLKGEEGQVFSKNYPNVRLSKRLDGGMNAETASQAITKHHMGGSWIKNNENGFSALQSSHSQQLQTCRDRIPWSCRFCQQESRRNSNSIEIRNQI